MVKEPLTLVRAKHSQLAHRFKAMAIDWDIWVDSGVTGDNQPNAGPSPYVTTFARLSASLLEQGVWMVVIAGADFITMDRHYCQLIEASLRSRLIVCTEHGAEVYGFDSSGSAQLRHRRLAATAEVSDQMFGDAVPGETALSDTAGALRRITHDVLSAENIAPVDTLIAVDDFGSVHVVTSGDETLLSHVEDAEAVDVGPEPGGRLLGALPLGGGRSALLSLLVDQVCLGYLTAHPSLADQRDTLDLAPLYSWLPELTDQHWPDPERDWRLPATGYMAGLEQTIESRLATGNGFLGLRSALVQPTQASHPAAFVAGLFDTIEIPGEATSMVSIPALASLPDGRRLHIELDGQEIDLERGIALALHRWLDLRRGLVVTDWLQSLPTGQSLRIRVCQATSLDCRGLAWQTVEISPGQSGMVTLVVPQVQPGADLVAEQVEKALVIWRTAHSLRRVAETRREALRLHDRELQEEITSSGQCWTWSAAAGQPATFTQCITYSRQQSELDTTQALAGRAAVLLDQAWSSGVSGLLAAHQQRWGERWAASDIQIQGDEPAQRALRFALYHLTSAANPEDERTSIGARGLTGEAYFGHVFWDSEIFMLPFFTFTWPEAARAMLKYRHHTLPAARAKAAGLGWRGALYAWESAETGDEVTPPTIAFPDGHREPVRNGSLEHHVSAAVAYAVWQYWKVTGDTSFLLDGGGEIILETARFWASRAVEEADSTYHIRHVIGPDEYHEDIDDDAYTNEMARWNIERGIEVAALLARHWRRSWRALSQVLDLQATELKYWRKVASGLGAIRRANGNLLEQFSGFFQLEPVDLQQFPTGGMPIDMVLGPERKQRSQVIKQADVILLLALLGNRFSPGESEANFDYYEPRCAHGSSLSPATHALVAARMGKIDLALHYFQQAAAIDLDDMLSASALGVHLGALGGLWQAVVFGFLGLSLEEKGLRLDPHLPGSWVGLALPIQWQTRHIRLAIQQSPLTISATLDQGSPLTLYIGRLGVRLRPHQTVNLLWNEREQRWREVKRELAG